MSSGFIFAYDVNAPRFTLKLLASKPLSILLLLCFGFCFFSIVILFEFLFLYHSMKLNKKVVNQLNELSTAPVSVASFGSNVGNGEP